MANTPLAHLPKCTLFAPPKFCISIVFNFPLGGCDTHEKKKNGWGGGGGGANKVHYGRCASGV